MASVNKVILIGNLGKDPEVRYTPSGTAVANFTIATTDRYQDEERTEWHRIVAFGRVAEVCGEYLSKGRQVYVEGRIQTREWEDRDGNKRYTTEIVVNNMQMLGSPQGGGGGSRGRDSYQDQPRQSTGGGGGRQGGGSSSKQRGGGGTGGGTGGSGYGQDRSKNDYEPPKNDDYGNGGPPNDDEIPF